MTAVALLLVLAWLVWTLIPPSLPSPREVEQHLVAEISRDPDHPGATARCEADEGRVRCLLRDAAGNYGSGGAAVSPSRGSSRDGSARIGPEDYRMELVVPLPRS